MNKILIVEDDGALRTTLASALESEGFLVLQASDGAAGLKNGSEDGLDLVVLDLVLPLMGGLEVCRRLREKGNRVPIIMLTGRKKEEIDTVLGLELGADDYMLKPFGVREFIARVRAVLRRGGPDAPRADAGIFGDVSIDFRKKTATKSGKDLPLTAKEFGLLELLVAHEGEVVGRDRILNEVWGYDKFPTTRTIDTFIRNLRRKVEDDPSNPVHILTVPWLGYRFKA